MTEQRSKYAAGDAYFIAPGHDGWVVGDEKLTGYEFTVGSKDFGPWTSKYGLHPTLR